MGQPAAVMGDRVSGSCAIHQIPNPASGAPQPTPGPIPFSAPLAQNLSTSVFIAGKPAAVTGSQGVSTPPHIGLHVSDPFQMAPMQKGIVTEGSATVLIDSKPAARSGSASTICGVPGGTLTGTATTVLIGG